MVQFDTRLPLMAQTPNVLGAVQQGTQMAGQVNALRRIAEQQNLYRQHGQGIASGDPAAMNALAGFDPGMAFDMNRQRGADARAERGLQISEAQLGMAREAAARAAEQHVMQMDAAEAARQAALIEQGLVKVAPLIAQARDTGDVTELNQALRTLGIPTVNDASGALFLAAEYGGVYEVFKRAGELAGGQGFRNASPEEAAQYGAQAGQFGPDGRFYPINPPSGMQLSATADGGFEFSQGPGVGGGMELAPLARGSGQARLPDESSPTGTRIVAEPGSEAANAQEASERAAASSAQNEQTRQSVVLQTTAQIRQMLERGRRNPLDLPEVGVIGSRLRNVNQEAADMAGMLDTLKGMVVFDRLQKLREASANGASGLGQVTNVEINLLAAQLGALDQSLSPDRLMATLDTIDSVFGKLSPAAQDYLTGATNALPAEGAARRVITMPDGRQFTVEPVE